MLEGIKNYIFFIVDQENKGILAYAYSPSVANSISKGLENSSVMLVPAFNVEKSILDSFNNNFRNNFKLVRKYYSPFSNGTIMPSEGNVCDSKKESEWNKHFDLVPITVSEEWIEKRKMAVLRTNKLKILETVVERYLTRFKNFTGDSFFYQYLQNQIVQCDVQKNYFTPSIIEWAEIYGVSPKAAYYELKMENESTAITIFRINAIWKKYVDLINKCYSKSELDKLEAAIETEIRLGKIE